MDFTLENVLKILGHKPKVDDMPLFGYVPSPKRLEDFARMMGEITEEEKQSIRAMEEYQKARKV